MPNTADAPPRNHQLDGLRGYAALAVVVYHSILGIDPTLIERVLGQSLQNIDSNYDRITKIVLALFGGDTAVVVFFLMSGAVLFASLRRESDRVGRTAMTFALKRVLRIYPALIVCLVADALVFPLFGLSRSPAQVLVNLSLYDFPLIGASWTLNVEIFAAPFIFIGYLGYRRWGEWGLLAVLIAVLLLLRAKLAFGGDLILFRQFAFCFALGMLIPTRIGFTIAQLSPRYTWIACMPVMLFAKHIILFGGFNTTATIQQISAALLVTLVYYNRAAPLCAVLRKPVSVFLGRISYTLYLSNTIYLGIITIWLRNNQPWALAHPLETGLVASMVAIAFTIPTAYLMTRAIEEPVIRLGRQIGRANDAATPSPSHSIAPATTPDAANAG